MNETRLSRRNFLQMAGLSAAGVALAACAAPVAPQEGAGDMEGGAEPQTVQFYTLVWQPGAVEAAQAAIDGWNAEHGSRITAEYSRVVGARRATTLLHRLPVG